MCADATLTPSLSPLPSTSRSLLSRLTSPLRSRSRNLTEFHIRPDDPVRKYSPGDTVKGAVVFTVVKPVRLTHLTVCLHGFVRVFKSANGANEPLPDLGLTPSSNPRKSQYFGNGHASLFQDEITLCGEGRLDIGVYEFNFELEFPKKGLPTSIDFERGTISYMITATVTRPTSIAATSSCGRKISLVETVDIGPLIPPKPRTISLEPISRKTRKRRTTKSKDGESQEGSKEDAGTGSGSEAVQIATSPVPDDSVSDAGSNDHQAAPRSPVPSEIQSTVSATNSVDSTVSSSTGLSFRLGAVPPGRSPRDSQQTGSKVSLADQTITATIELLKAGCLPGESFPLRISIKHTKAIKSMHGIIITLYRQGRIDSAPPLSLFADIKGKEAERLKHEEYYPKSKTGLGGLSLTSAGSSSMFRKDLAQTFAPILIDPGTLNAVVNVSVRVPEDTFPTISGVPGQMITFKYHLEVVVDLGGKLAGQQRHVPRLGAVTVPAGNRGDGSANMLAAFGGSIVDTENIRREKSVVACIFEVVVGTINSVRNRDRADSAVKRQISEWSEEAAVVSVPSQAPIYEEEIGLDGEEMQNGDHHYRYPSNPYQNEPYEERFRGDYYPNEEYGYESRLPTHAQIPPPAFEDEQALDEKERARRAEERLLPSQPPNGTEMMPSTSRTIVPPIPGAPPTEPDDDIYGTDDVTPQVTSSTVHPLQHTRSPEISQAPSAPVLEDLANVNGYRPTEDKQELERRRLLAEASAPSFPAEEEEDAGDGPSTQQQEPSAPPLPDVEYGGQYSHHDLPGPSSHGDLLPKYER